MALIPVEGDTRVPMAQIHSLYAGRATPDDVLAAARAEGRAGEQRRPLMYAHLYLGLFYEAAGDAEKAKEHIGLAADRYALENDYMSDVARVHATALARGAGGR